ncbi:hypothetical protein ACHAQA_001221 [Verticillium albo-atrum]
MAPIKAWAAFAALSLVSTVHAWHVELPPCVDKFQPFVNSGCYANPNGKSLTYRSSTSSREMTVEKCVAECKGNGYRYAGLEYYGVCYCGNTVNGAELEQEECSFPCNGDKSQTCGGNKKLSVYADPTFPTINAVEIEDYVNTGCWTDESKLGKTLSWPQDQLDKTVMTPSLCLSACREGGFPFAGLEYGRECWCGAVMGNDTRSVDTTQCNMACAGDKSQTCGGRSRVNVFLAKEFQSLEPCGYQPGEPAESSAPVISYPASISTLVPSLSTVSSDVPSSAPVSSPPSSAVSSSASSSVPYSVPPSVPSSAPVSSSSSTTCTTSTTLVASTTSTTLVASTTSTQAPTTTAPPTTTKPATTTKPPAVCTTEIVTPPKNEYCCGKWCSTPIPDFDEKDTCFKGKAKCGLQVAACLKQAGWPGALECFNFQKWCQSIDGYCGSKCKKGKKGSCSKKDCFSNYKPVGGGKPVTSTSTFPCAATATPTTTPVETPTVPEPTGICIQPSNSKYGYGPGKPVGDIELPVVTCNDLEADYKSGNHFKIYWDSDSRKCRSYQRTKVPSACADACREQYEDCNAVYAKACWSFKLWRNRREIANEPATSPALVDRSPNPDVVVDKRFFFGKLFGDSFSVATNKCKAQYNDCINVNKRVTGAGVCSSYGKY